MSDEDKKNGLNPVIDVNPWGAYRVTPGGEFGDLLLYRGEPGRYCLDRSFQCPAFARISGVLYQIYRVDVIEDGRGSMLVRKCCPVQRNYPAFDLDRFLPDVLFSDDSELIPDEAAYGEIVNHWSALGDGPATVKTCVGRNPILLEIGSRRVYDMLIRHAVPVLLGTTLAFIRKNSAEKIKDDAHETGAYAQMIRMPHGVERFVWVLSPK